MEVGCVMELMEAGCYGSRVLWKQSVMEAGCHGSRVFHGTDGSRVSLKQGVMEVGCVMELMEAGCHGSRVLWK